MKDKINIAVVLLITAFKTIIGSIAILLGLCLVFHDHIELLGYGNEYLIIILIGGIIASVSSVLYCLIVLLPVYFIDKEFIKNYESFESYKRLIPFPALFASAISSFFIPILIDMRNEEMVIILMFILNLFCMAYMGLYFFLSTLKSQQNKST